MTQSSNTAETAPYSLRGFGLNDQDKHFPQQCDKIVELQQWVGDLAHSGASDAAGGPAEATARTGELSEQLGAARGRRSDNVAAGSAEAALPETR